MLHNPQTPSQKTILFNTIARDHVRESNLWRPGMQVYYWSRCWDGESEWIGFDEFPYFDSMVLKPILDGAFAIFGRSPAKMLKWSPKVWSLLYRNCGQLLLAESDDRSATLEGIDLPPELVASASYMKGFAAAILGFFDVLGIDAECELRELGRGRTAFFLTWKS